MPRMTSTVAALALLILFLSTPAGAQAIDPSFRADIEKLLEVTGARAQGTQMAMLVSNSVLDSMKQAQSNVPDRAVAIIKEVLGAEFAKAFEPAGEISANMVGLYAKYFTHDDVVGLLGFYSSSVGRKAIAVLPMLTQEGAAAGQQWAQANMPRVLGVLQQRLRAEGLIK